MNKPRAFILEGENNFEDCVFMKLHSTPIQVEPAQSASSIPSGFLSKLLNLLSRVFPRLFPSAVPITTNTDIGLTLRFGLQEMKVPGGSVWVGLNWGKLMLKLENGRMPLEKQKFIARFPLAIKKEDQEEKGGGITVAVSPAPSGTLKATGKEAVKDTYDAYQIRSQGTEESPYWVFVSQKKDPLNGQINEQPLGPIEVKDSTKPCSVDATFEIRGQRDLFLVESIGLLESKKLSRDWTALVTTEFYRWFIAPKLTQKSYLCRIKGGL